MLGILIDFHKNVLMKQVGCLTDLMFCVDKGNTYANK